MSCNTLTKNVGSKCHKNFGIQTGVLFSLSPFIGTTVQMKTKTFWQTLFQKNGNERVFYVNVDQAVLVNNEQVMEELDGGKSVEVGRKGGKDMFKIANPSDVLFNNIHTWNGAKVYFMPVYGNGFFTGKQTDGLNIEQLIGQMFVTSEKVTNSTSSKISFSIQQDSNDIINSELYRITVDQNDTDFVISEDFYSVQSAIVTVNETLSTSSDIVFSYKTEEGADIKGLLKADVTVKNSGLVAQPINTLTELTNLGLQYYKANFSTPLVASTYTVSTVDPETMTIKGFETIVADTHVVV